ncbi:hypothetical protein AB0J25_02540 [Streptomyces sp. NPDC049910]|uniref:hypothetical protein n=1 Tax=Streptomyces sp. NPDC049910 TaxID=3155278 RepID=UPI00341427D4
MAPDRTTGTVQRLTGRVPRSFRALVGALNDRPGGFGTEYESPRVARASPAGRPWF